MGSGMRSPCGRLALRERDGEATGRPGGVLAAAGLERAGEARAADGDEGEVTRDEGELGARAPRAGRAVAGLERGEVAERLGGERGEAG